MLWIFRKTGISDLGAERSSKMSATARSRTEYTYGYWLPARSEDRPKDEEMTKDEVELRQDLSRPPYRGVRTVRLLRKVVLLEAEPPGQGARQQVRALRQAPVCPAPGPLLTPEIQRGLFVLCPRV
jgi:hypothetical protein